MIGAIVGGVLLLAFSPASTPRLTVGTPRRCHVIAFETQRFPQQSARIRRPPRGGVTAFEGKDASLSNEQVEAIFGEFDTSGDGFIDSGELHAALAKAGQPVSMEKAAEILKTVDENGDGRISLDEFKAVFKLAPSAVPDALRGLFDVRTFFLGGLNRVGDALGIEVSGQWRTTGSGSRYVDDLLGDGKLVLPGDVVQLHYTVTLLSNDKVVETSRGGLPLGFEVGEPEPSGQGWNDAVAGMRIGGKRRVYAKPDEGDGPTARYDIEIVGLEEGASSKREGIIATLGGRRAATRTLFALSFVPYFLPADARPAFFASKPQEVLEQNQEVKVNQADEYVAKQLDALFTK